MGVPPKDLQNDSVFSRFLPATATLLTPLAFSAFITKTPTCPVPRRRMRRSSNPPKVCSANLSAAEPIVVAPLPTPVSARILAPAEVARSKMSDRRGPLAQNLRLTYYH